MRRFVEVDDTRGSWTLLVRCAETLRAVCWLTRLGSHSGPASRPTINRWVLCNVVKGRFMAEVGEGQKLDGPPVTKGICG